MRTLFLIWLLCANCVVGQTVQISVPNPPGGPTDTFARAIARYLSSALSREHVVVNRTGADGRIAVDYVGNQPADGQSLLVASTGTTLFNSVMFKRLNHDHTSFDHVVPMVRTPTVMAVPASSPVRSWNDFVQLSHTKPINCGGAASSQVFVGRYLLRAMNMTQAQVVPFRGSADMNPQLISGQLDCAFDTQAFSLGPLHRDQRVRIILSGAQHSTDTTVMTDLVPGLTAHSWFGISIRKGTAKSERDRLFAALLQAHRDREFRTVMTAGGMEVVDNPQTTGEWLQSEIQRWDQMRQRIGLDRVDQ